MDIELDHRSRIEWIILSDFAEVVNGKLYLTGGGWDLVKAAEGFPFQRIVGIAVSVLVPWTETNEVHALKVEVQDDDAKSVLAMLEGQFEVGRPPGLPRGQVQRFQLGVTVSLQFEKAGGYNVVAHIDGQAEAHTSFFVIQ